MRSDVPSPCRAANSPGHSAGHQGKRPGDRSRATQNDRQPGGRGPKRSGLGSERVTRPRAGSARRGTQSDLPIAVARESAASSCRQLTAKEMDVGAAASICTAHRKPLSPSRSASLRGGRWRVRDVVCPRKVAHMGARRSASNGSVQGTAESAFSPRQHPSRRQPSEVAHTRLSVVILGGAGRESAENRPSVPIDGPWTE